MCKLHQGVQCSIFLPVFFCLSSHFSFQNIINSNRKNPKTKLFMMNECSRNVLNLLSSEQYFSKICWRKVKRKIGIFLQHKNVMNRLSIVTQCVLKSVRVLYVVNSWLHRVMLCTGIHDRLGFFQK